MGTELVGQGEQNQPERSKRLRSERLLIVALILVVSGLAAYCANQRAQQVSASESGVAPAFKLARYGGGTVSLADLRGKVVMLNFWATWCLPCVAEMPTLTKLAREYEPKGLVFLAANLDERETASAQVAGFVAQTAPDLAKSIVFADEQMATSYEVEDLPTMYFIGRDRRILESYAGITSESMLRQKIEGALKK